jgi:hypothetical protein
MSTRQSPGCLSGMHSRLLVMLTHARAEPAAAFAAARFYSSGQLTLLTSHCPAVPGRAAVAHDRSRATRCPVSYAKYTLLLICCTPRCPHLLRSFRRVILRRPSRSDNPLRYCRPWWNLWLLGESGNPVLNCMMPLSDRWSDRCSTRSECTLCSSAYQSRW